MRASRNSRAEQRCDGRIGVYPMGWVAVGMVGAMAMEARTRRRHGKGRLIRIRGNNETAQFLHFWYDFLVGDDWMIAAGVVLALALSAGLALLALAMGCAAALDGGQR